jgi:hypothetical protein
LKTGVEAKNVANDINLVPTSVAIVKRSLWEAGLIAIKVVKRPALKKEHVQFKYIY